MSNFVEHRSCPRCGSRDNLGVWDDGHCWCFGCGYYVPPEVTINDVLPKEVVKLVGDQLPSDCSAAIPKEPMMWLKKYSLTNKEIAENNILWSQSQQMLIFPYFAEGRLLMWQGRYFPARNPKVFTAGYPEDHLILKGDQRNSVVIVEDAVSQIKVSRVECCCCLFGAHLSLHKSLALSRYFDNLFLWLDNDKIKEMMRFQTRYTHLFKNVKIIISDVDPKEHSEEEIRKYLTE